MSTELKGYVSWFIYWIFFGEGINVSSFMIVEYVWQILGRGTFLPPPPPSIREQSRKNPSWIGLIIPIEVVIKFFLGRMWLFLIIFSQRWSSEMWCLIILFVILLKTITCIHKTIAYLRLLLIQNEIIVTIPCWLSKLEGIQISQTW